MRRLLLILVALYLLPHCDGAYISLQSDLYCGDDICSEGESCKNCKWDCGVCPDEDEEGSGGGHIGEPPQKKSMQVYDAATGTYIQHTIDSSSYAVLENDSEITKIRLRVRNEQDSTIPAIRIHLEAYMNWFRPKELDYALPPDGFTGSGWPYWDVPPIEPNESLEIYFTLNGSVGFANLIEIKTEPLARWDKGCEYPAPLVNASSARPISDLLDMINMSQGISIFHEEQSGNSTLALAYLDGNGSFGVFFIKGTNTSFVSESNTISAVASGFAKANSKNMSENISRPYEILLDAREVKNSPESSCMVITGMDRFNCTDRQSCFYSCFSVPVCSMIANGWPFIDTLQDYKVNIDKANAAFNQSIASADAFRNDPSHGNAQLALDGMEGLNKAGTQVMYHPLFADYNFCEPADYALMQQIEAKIILHDYLEANCLYAEVPGMVNQSQGLALELIPLINAAEQAAANATNISAEPNITAPQNLTGIEPEEEIPQEECCVLGLCSMAGITESWGVCWQWWALMLGMLLICLAYAAHIAWRKTKH